jgi:Na+-translocating ferredoxin:NAD+ oxidoreductase subunit D
MTKALLSQDIRTGTFHEKSVADNHLLHLSSSPHLRHSHTVPYIMKQVIFALIPAVITSVLLFQVEAIVLICLSIATAMSTEWLFCKFLKRPSTLNDYSAIVTGLLLGLSLPPLVPWWIAIAGSFFSICVAKMIFGGLGANFVNPALAGRAFLTICFPITMISSWKTPSWGTISGVDAISSATPLAYLKELMQSGSVDTTYLQNTILHLIIGNVGGSLGETSVVALLIGAGWLLYKKIIGFKISFAFVSSFFIIAWFFNGTGYFFSTEALLIPVFQIFAGGLMLGALFMANDSVTSPITQLGKIIFGIGCGLLTFCFRNYTIFAEGVAFAILTMNIFSPLLEKYTKPKVYGKMDLRG